MQSSGAEGQGHQTRRVFAHGSVLVFLRGPGAEFALPFTEAVFAGPAKGKAAATGLSASFGERGRLACRFRRRAEKLFGCVARDAQRSTRDACAPRKRIIASSNRDPGASARALATPDQFARLGNNRAPVVRPPLKPS